MDPLSATYYVALGPRCLPQGAPTSPALTNTLCMRLDRRLSALATKLGWRYTRYADDLTFSLPESHKDKPRLGALLGSIGRVANDEGFRVHPNKTRIARAGSRQKVTGLVVNGGGAPQVPRELKRQVRAAIHNASHGKPLQAGESVARLSGYAAYILHDGSAARGEALEAARRARRPVTVSGGRGWVVPDGHESALVTVERGETGTSTLRSLSWLPVPAMAPCALDLEADQLVFAQGDLMTVLRGLRRGEDYGLAFLQLPAKYKVHAVTLRGGVAYVGGCCGDEVLGRVDLELDPLRFEPMEVPAYLRQWGKTIDAFIWRGEQLLAVDDREMPKWVLLYDTAPRGSSRLVASTELRAHGPYETVRAAAGGERLIGVLSSSGGRGGSLEILALLDGGSLREMACLYVREPAGPGFSMVALDVVGDRVVVARGKAGVGVLDTASLHSLHGSADPSAPAPGIDCASLLLVPVAGGRAVGIWAVNPELALVAVADEAGQHRTSLVSLPPEGAAKPRFAAVKRAGNPFSRKRR